MRQGQLDELAVRLQHEGDARGPLVPGRFVEDVAEGVGQPPRPLGFEDCSGVGDLSLQRKGRADLPVGLDLGVEPIAPGKGAVGQRFPKFLRRGLDIGDVDELGLRVCPGTSNGITEFSEHEAD